MSNKTVKKHNISIPLNVSVIYSKKKKILIFLGPIKIRSLKLKVQLFLDNSKKIINVSPIVFSQISNKEKKKNHVIQRTTAAQIKYMLIESSILLHKKLNINGVGYRSNFTENFNNNLLTFKLGYSHFIYMQTFNELTISYLTKTKLCLFGNSYANISQFVSRIRKNKTPDPYKAKGILYDNEKIEIKEGKKI
jgi:large subunit ribosomal protein L6